MSQIWSKGINTLCIHPGRKILKGWEEIRPSWQKIFTVTTTLVHRQMQQFGQYLLLL
jgi:hypothetical protein